MCFWKQVYLYTEIQEKGGNKVCSATSTHLAGCQFLPVHLHLTEGTKQDKWEVVSVFQSTAAQDIRWNLFYSWWQIMKHCVVGQIFVLNSLAHCSQHID